MEPISIIPLPWLIVTGLVALGYEQSRIPIRNLSRDPKTDLNRSNRDKFLNGRSPGPRARKIDEMQKQSLSLLVQVAIDHAPPFNHKWQIFTHSPPNHIL